MAHTALLDIRTRYCTCVSELKEYSVSQCCASAAGQVSEAMTHLEHRVIIIIMVHTTATVIISSHTYLFRPV